MELKQLRELYARTLLDDVIPFWMRHGLDREGGINSCLGNDGSLVTRERWGWSQWRAVWVFSHLYLHFGQRPEWLAAAKSISAFVRAHGPLANGHWPMLMEPDGTVKRGYESIFNDGFAIYALVELWRATREDELLDAALGTYQIVRDELTGLDLPPVFPYPPAPDRRCLAHGLSMLFSSVLHELALATNDSQVREAAAWHHRRVMDVYLRSDRGLVFEWLRTDTTEFPPPQGTAVIPGHAIESMWFQMHIARDKNDTATLDRACETIRKHLEIGWDREFGGLFYAVDADNRPEVGWPFAQSKLWWPHTEAPYATLLAYEHCRQDWCLEWHEKVRAWSYAHFPVPEHGEWYQKLDRQGRPFTDVVALPVKDPFHLPRALMLSVECLDRLGAGV